MAACIPYTWGAHAFIHINSMGATLSQVTRELIALWVLTGAYGLLACILFYIRKNVSLPQLNIPESEEVQNTVQTDG